MLCSGVFVLTMLLGVLLFNINFNHKTLTNIMEILNSLLLLEYIEPMCLEAHLEAHV